MNEIDFHCHLDDETFNGRRREVVAECFDAGFSALVTVADPYSEESLPRTLEGLDANDRVFLMAAAHPHQADEYNAVTEKRLEKMLAHPRTIGFGEAGLDFHYDLSSRENQQRVFERQIAMAREARLPLVIHSRKSEPQVMETLERLAFTGPVAFHCYTGNSVNADEILKRGYLISFSGIITFRNAGELREVATRVPLEKVLTETDSPYLAPEPHRGRPNRSFLVRRVVETLAELHEVKTADVTSAVSHSLAQWFGVSEIIYPESGE